ncbi:MAG: hypothetical protein AB7N99_06995 [Simkaniaceae bacterium]
MEEEAIFIYCLTDCVVCAVSCADDPRSLMTHGDVTMQSPAE